MYNRYLDLVRKTFMGLGLAMICGGFNACKDDYDLDDEGNYPSWLGSSIYEALKNPASLESSGNATLTGTFNNYVRLIEDLGEAETLGKTGSKTIFPANDEAFERFFKDNSWGVSKYEDLTPDMKKKLLYSSMLDNALLIEMLSNISDGTTAVLRGQAMRHYTAINTINTISNWSKADMPVNNQYWQKYYNGGIHIVSDATTQMMIHFTEEQMTANSITTRGDNSDFEVLTGSKYNASEHSAYIFRNKIINPDVTCKNGYIHQMQDVLVPPGNLAEVIRNGSNSKLWSRMLDRFCAPFNTSNAQQVTKNYNDYAQLNNIEQIDTVFEMRYFSSYSQGAELKRDPNSLDVPEILPFDPGWNTFSNGNVSTDIAAMFVPTDEALQKYFLPGGEGEFLIKTFGKKPNTLENLEENIDSIPLQNVNQLISNLMQRSFLGTVPSKFGHVTDEANDPMGLTLDVINKNDNGTYDVKIANNGVAYMLNKMFAPPSLIAVSAPVTLNKSMRIMNEAVNDGKNRTPLGLGLNFYAYLLAMSANYGFFIPNDEAFGKFYVDPTYLDDAEPRALRFYYQNRAPYVFCSAWHYDKATGTIGDSIKTVSTVDFRTQFTDILNYHTVVLNSGEKMGDGGRKYYKTKHGAGIIFNGSNVKAGDVVINGETTTSNILQTLTQQNGISYEIDHVIQAPQQSVLNVIENNSQLNEFKNLCSWHFDVPEEEEDFTAEKLMAFASDKLVDINNVTNKKRYEAYQTFVSKGGLTYNVNYFSSYNYTVYAPDDDAMRKAYALGLPTWNDVKQIYDEYHARMEEEKSAGSISAEVQAARDKALAMIYEINNFVRYHFQDNSVFADKVVDQGDYPTACSDSLGIRQKLNITGSNDMITVRDANGQSIDINKTLCNQLTRDYVLNKTNHTILTSSFAVVHQISTPLNTHVVRPGGDNGRYDYAWAGKNAASRLKAFRKQYEANLYKQYDREYEH
jgi:uncharacterized surface protein with fasciclin (FAS1) repeats